MYFIMIIDSNGVLVPVLDYSNHNEIDMWYPIRMFKSEKEANKFIDSDESYMGTFARENGFYIYNEHSCQ